MSTVNTILLWVGAFCGAIFMKTYIPRFAGWNFLVLLGVALVTELFLVMFAVFVYALSK